jgi:hypothetical protein
VARGRLFRISSAQAESFELHAVGRKAEQSTNGLAIKQHLAGIAFLDFSGAAVIGFEVVDDGRYGRTILGAANDDSIEDTANPLAVEHNIKRCFAPDFGVFSWLGEDLLGDWIFEKAAQEFGSVFGKIIELESLCVIEPFDLGKNFVHLGAECRGVEREVYKAISVGGFGFEGRWRKGPGSPSAGILKCRASDVRHGCKGSEGVGLDFFYKERPAARVFLSAVSESKRSPAAKTNRAPLLQDTSLIFFERSQTGLAELPALVGTLDAVVVFSDLPIGRAEEFSGNV